MKNGSAVIIGASILIGSCIVAIGDILGGMIPVCGSNEWYEYTRDDHTHELQSKEEDRVIIKGFHT